jgi:hypothetical protein
MVVKKRSPLRDSSRTSPPWRGRFEESGNQKK